MKRIMPFSISALLLLAVIAAGNDSVYYANGAHMQPMTDDNISIRKEVLTIQLDNDGYATVDVNYELYNSGLAKTVVMGFEAAAPYNEDFNPGGNPYIRNFSVRMNGNPLNHSVSMVESGRIRDNDCNVAQIDSGLYKKGEYSGTLIRKSDSAHISWSYAYHFKAHFKPGINHVQHRYRYRMSEGVGFAYAVDYKLSPALRWANRRIDDFTLIVRAGETHKHFRIMGGTFPDSLKPAIYGIGKFRMRKSIDPDNNHEDMEIVLRNGEAHLHVDNFVPADELKIVSADYPNGTWQRVDNPETVAYEPSAHFAFSYYDQGTLYPDNADSLWVKRIMRNLPFAARGYVFANKRLKDFFERVWWYMPDPQYRPSSEGLTNEERKMVEKNR